MQLLEVSGAVRLIYIGR